MRWDRSHESSNVEDRRGEAGPGIGMGGLGLLLPLFGRFGWRGILVLLALFLVWRYVDCPGGGSSQFGNMPAESSASEDELVRFVGFVFDDAQATLGQQVEHAGRDYRPAKLVVYRSAVSTGCGTASSAVGPFYCPRDFRVYIDLSFYRELRDRFGAPGDFAQAYVIGHELGHHVQNLVGDLESRSNRDSVAVELQADCLSGVWAKDAERRQLLETGDLSEAIGAASAVGDDRIQRQTTGDIRPETWTHGSAEQRAAAFQRGYRGGELRACGL